MVLTQKDIDDIIRFVKQEPRTIQEISKKIGRSWVTADSYTKQVRDRTGLISIKTFRKGSQGALKIAYYSSKEALAGEDVKSRLYTQIRHSRTKNDFDSFEIFQFVDDRKKKAFTKDLTPGKPTGVRFINLLREAESTIYLFSGNISFISLKEGKTTMLQAFEELLKRKVMIKILCRTDIGSLNNLSKLDPLLKKYPEFLELRHSYQPLRGFIIDDRFARLTTEVIAERYKRGEVNKNMKVFYDIHDEEWVSWLQKVFWNLFRTSIDYRSRTKQLERFV